MEDVFSVAYQQTEDEKDLEYAYFGIFDGHGGREAAAFAKEHLMDFIVKQKGFWSEDDETVLKAIKEGFIQCHHAMWRAIDLWPRTPMGLPSTAGTTASIAFIRRGKIYTGHVGDSAIILGQQVNPDKWEGLCLTRDHKPENPEEAKRIHESGGRVVNKSGVPRVVWNRPKMGHKGAVRRSTQIDEIPFLAVARSLGDLWSYNSEKDVFIVSPEPDTNCHNIDISKHRCLILGTDGCWNMLNAEIAVDEVCSVEKSNEQHMLNPNSGKQWINPSKRLVDRAISQWHIQSLRPDNTSVVTVMLDPPGPPRAQVLKRQREMLNASGTPERGSMALVTNQEEPEQPQRSAPAGLSIISRFPNAANLRERNLAEASGSSASNSRVLHDFQPRGSASLCRLSTSTKMVGQADSTASDPEDDSSSCATTVPVPNSDNENIQCNEVSSSEDLAKTPSRKLKKAASTALTPKLSRELSALQLDRRAQENTPKTRSRARSTSESHSDTENEAPKAQMSSGAKKKIEMLEQDLSQNNLLLKNNPHFLRSKEAKVKKSTSCTVPASNIQASSPTTVMSLRPRPQATPSAETPSRKRKQEDLASTSCKSPKMMPIINTKPVMTRSRTARVLTLKK